MNNSSNSVKALIIVLILIGLGAAFINRGGRLHKDDSDSSTTETTAYTRIDFNKFSIEIGDDWNLFEYSDYTYYSAVKMGLIFAISDAYTDGGETPESTLQALASAMGGEIKRDLSDERQAADGTPYKTAYVKVPFSNYSMLFSVVFCEQKNLDLVVAAQCYNDKQEDIAYDELARMCDSIIFTDTPDIVTGKTFYMDMEQLTAELHDDGTFLLYNDKQEADAAHASGTYEVYRGREAVEKVESMEEYGLTFDEQKRTINSRVEFWDDYYAVIFHATEAVQDGGAIEADSTILYVGFANDDHESLSMTACNKFINETWTYAE